VCGVSGVWPGTAYCLKKCLFFVYRCFNILFSNVVELLINERSHVVFSLVPLVNEIMQFIIGYSINVHVYK